MASKITISISITVDQDEHILDGEKLFEYVKHVLNEDWSYADPPSEIEIELGEHV